jgi:hypothetical protein
MIYPCLASMLLIPAAHCWLTHTPNFHKARHAQCAYMAACYQQASARHRASFRTLAAATTLTSACCTDPLRLSWEPRVSGSHLHLRVQDQH